MARQLLILCPCLPHGIETVACRSSCSLDSSRSRPEAMRHGLTWREVMRAATSVDSAAGAPPAWTFREAETSGGASLAGAPVRSGSPPGRTPHAAPSRRCARRSSRSRAWRRPAAPRYRCRTTGCAPPAPTPCRSPPAATAGRATDDGSCRTPQPSRCTVSGEKAGTHTATYSAPSGSGEPYCTHSPRRAMTACPARTSIVPPAWFTRSRPFSTTVYSSNSGVCPGSTQPAGLRMCATLTASVFELMRPTYSSICFGTLPAATMRAGWVMCSGMEPRDGRRGREHGRLVQGELAEARAHTGVRRDRGRELDVGLMVARLGGEEPAVEPRERGVVERLGEEPHAFAAPRL